MDFAKIAPYLKDPLVLMGFMLFLAFLLARRLITSGIIPPVEAGLGAGIIRLLLHYGFIIGLLIIILGFGLKYKDLSDQEQNAAVGLLNSELQHNLYIVSELHKNTATLTNAAEAVASVLRMERLKINHGLFPPENIDPNVEENADLYNQRFDWLVSSGLLADKDELRRFHEQNAAIVRTVNRTISTIKSLGDRQVSRYVIHSDAYRANLPVLRKLTIVKPDQLAALYAKTEEVREKYFRIAETVEEYLDSVRAYCSENTPNRTALGAVLAAERLTIRLLYDHKMELESLVSQTEEQAKKMIVAVVN